MHGHIKKLSERDVLDLAKNAASGKDLRMKESGFYAWVHEFADTNGPSARATLLRDTLSCLLSEQETKIDQLDYPANVRDLVRSEFQRIQGALAHAEDNYFDLKNHAARSDFRIVCFSRIPMGFEHMESGGVSRSLLYRGGVSQAIRFIRMLAQTGGVAPFFNLHMSHGIRPTHFLLAVNHEAQVHQYRNIAETLKMNPQYRGVACGSWWFDPQLETISLPLVFLRTFMTERGAFLFRYGKHTKGHAFANSPRRQKLHAEGKYNPISYSIVWPRDSLIRWADQHES